MRPDRDRHDELNAVLARGIARLAANPALRTVHRCGLCNVRVAAAALQGHWERHRTFVPMAMVFGKAEVLPTPQRRRWSEGNA